MQLIVIRNQNVRKHSVRMKLLSPKIFDLLKKKKQFLCFIAQYYAGVRVFDQTPECSREGGFCVANRDCAESTKKSGLCDSGIECCYRGMKSEFFSILILTKKNTI